MRLFEAEAVSWNVEIINLEVHFLYFINLLMWGEETWSTRDLTPKDV